ncbi:LiaI-LiaF-like domain-containing protein [Sphingobacterium wenxiniae]|uniref:LiaI-LiaF-like transmembrane region domain-containing protein n=1 Tax=Sphingobacterium wenxiniae TaxID=683125 RepID=A0A1I6TSF3_9SPHI|nr:DUF5668 domain-containing protein [Sphingobacterium wenxiniae]SFS92018.1 hypothetical protein SAMN05660206_1074 [Sphingobacterium wenxiniae]
MENKIISGIWFVCIGLLLLLHNLDVIDFNLWAIVKYWPLSVILVGVNLMVQNRAYGGYIKIACNVLFLGWIVFVGLSSPNTGWTPKIFNNGNISFSNDKDNKDLLSTVSVPYEENVQEVKFDFNGGAGAFEIAPSDAKLLEATCESEDMGLRLESKNKDGEQKIELTAKPKGKKNNKVNRKVAMSLHTAPVWDMELNYGAAKFSGDLSPFKIKKLDINTGASSMDLKLGEPQLETTKIKIATGASTIHLHIPKDAPVRIKYSTIASSNNLEGFDNMQKGLATSNNYDNASKRFDIELDGAANTFTISRY